MMPVRPDHPNHSVFTHDGQGTNAYWGEGFSDIIGLTVGTHVYYTEATC